MSKTLRDLVVSLPLQSDNFTRNIKSVNKQIQDAESRFKLAATGVEGFEKTATGLTTQLFTLERHLSLQKDVVTQCFHLPTPILPPLSTYASIFDDCYKLTPLRDMP